MLTAGDMIGEHWQVERKLGEGGVGAVFLCHHVSDSTRRAAVKLILPPRERLAAALRTRAHREAAILEQLEHPGIVRILEHGDDPRRGLVYLVMDFVDGEQLSADVVRPNGTLQTDLVRGLFDRILDALAYAHEKQVAHRDMKRQNVLIRRSDGRPVLVDWGSVFVDEGERLTRFDDSHALGRTDHYAPPEALLNPAGADPYKWDAYSVGVMLHNTLTGNDSPYADDLDLHHLAMEKMAASLDPGEAFDPVLREVVRRSTAPLPNQRFKTLAQMRATLGAATMTGGRPTFVPTAGTAAGTVIPTTRALDGRITSSPDHEADDASVAADPPSIATRQGTLIPSATGMHDDGAEDVPATPGAVRLTSPPPIPAALAGRDVPRGAAPVHVPTAPDRQETDAELRAQTRGRAPMGMLVGVGLLAAAVVGMLMLNSRGPTEPATPAGSTSAPTAAEAPFEPTVAPAEPANVATTAPPMTRPPDAAKQVERTPPPPVQPPIAPAPTLPAAIVAAPPTAPPTMTGVARLDAMMNQSNGEMLRQMVEDPRVALDIVSTLSHKASTEAAQETIQAAQRKLLRDVNASPTDGQKLIRLLKATPSALLEYVRISEQGQGGTIPLAVRLELAAAIPDRVKQPVDKGACQELGYYMDKVGRPDVVRSREGAWVPDACRSCAGLGAAPSFCEGL